MHLSDRRMAWQNAKFVYLLEILDELLQHPDALRLELACEQRSLAVFLRNRGSYR